MADLKAHFKSSGLTQSEYSKKSGVNQATISRLLKTESNRTRLSSGLVKLWNYASINIYRHKVNDIMTQTELLNALESVWDGTESHAKALTKLLEALGGASRHNSM